VVFVGRILRKGSSEEKHLTGTAFCVGMESPDKDTTHLYLVTAKHIADLLAQGEWFMRYNTTAGCEEVRRDGTVRWWTHPDPEQAPSVDAAVTTFAAPADADLKYIPVRNFATDEVIAHRNIGPGSQVYITGLFTKMTGRARNIPLMRLGNVAMIPDE